MGNDENIETAETWMDDINPEEAPNDVIKYDITSSPNDWNVSTLISFIDSGSIIIPRYQRNYVWDKKRASKLIESLILGLPVPQLFLYQEEKNRFSILDGQQRLLTIYFFYKMRFPKSGKRTIMREKYSEFNKFATEFLQDNEYFSEFSLFFGRNREGNNNPLQGCKYDTLGDNKINLDLATIRCVIIKQNSPEEDDSSSVYEIFDRLNTGGVNLKPQQIRANIYHGEFFEQLFELNKNSKWRELIKRPNRDDNSRDEELILRMLAMLYFGHTNYSPSMTQFLNRFSNKMKHETSENITFLINVFKGFLQLITAEHIDNFFSDGRFSIGVAESVFCASASNAWSGRNIDALKPFTSEYVETVSAEIRETLQVGSSQSDNVKTRLDKAVKLLK